MTPLLFLAPLLVLLGVFRLWPVIQAVRLSLYNWNGITPARWIGLGNYRTLLHDPAFWQALKTNGLILIGLPVWVFLPLLLAIILHERVFGWRFFRFAFFLPAVLSPVIIGSFFGLMLGYSGPINVALRDVGLGGLAHQWLVDPSLALPTLVAIVIWAVFGTGVLIYLSAMATIDRNLYDAAQIDGANWLQTQRFVTLPQLRPTISFYAVVSLIGAYSAMFPFVYTLTRGGPGNVTTTLEFDVYQQAFSNGAFGYASAIGVVLFALLALLVGLFQWLIPSDTLAS